MTVNTFMEFLQDKIIDHVDGLYDEDYITDSEINTIMEYALDILQEVVLDMDNSNGLASDALDNAIEDDAIDHWDDADY